jgi:uncharacterized repeat protein (TIGR01451 family)
VSPTDTQGIDRDTYLKMVAPDLAIAQQVSPAVVRTGTDLTITLTVTNKRPASAPGVVVSDALPAATTFVSCVAGESGVCGGSGNERTVSFDALAGGVSAKITFVARMNGDVANGARVTNTATVRFDGTDPNPADNEATETVTSSR